MMVNEKSKIPTGSHLKIVVIYPFDYVMVEVSLSFVIGATIEDIHAQWWNDYELLERHHGYIQWLVLLQFYDLSFIMHHVLYPPPWGAKHPSLYSTWGAKHPKLYSPWGAKHTSFYSPWGAKHPELYSTVFTLCMTYPNKYCIIYFWPSLA
jgi:hypothetical protein